MLPTNDNYSFTKIDLEGTNYKQCPSGWIVRVPNFKKICIPEYSWLELISALENKKLIDGSIVLVKEPGVKTQRFAIFNNQLYKTEKIDE
jgi:hypothetical protein